MDALLWEWQIANESRPKTRLRLNEYKELVESVAVLTRIDLSSGSAIGDELDDVFRSWVERVEDNVLKLEEAE